MRSIRSWRVGLESGRSFTGAASHSWSYKGYSRKSPPGVWTMDSLGVENHGGVLTQSMACSMPTLRNGNAAGAYAAEKK